MFVTIGATTIDLFVEDVDRLPQATGEHFQASNVIFCDRPARFAHGGNATNSAIVLARLGAEVRLVSDVGADAAGDVVTRWIAAAGVDLRWFHRRSDVATSTAALIVDRAGNRIVFHHPGAYECLRAEDLPAGWATGVHTVLLGGYPLLHGLRSAGGVALLAQAKAAGARTAVDIGPALSDFSLIDELALLFPWVDYLLSNDHEVRSCTGAATWEEGATALIEAGATAVVVKRGENGSVICRGRERVSVPALKVKVEQTVGAGDTFDAGFLFALARGDDDVQAMRFAAATAAQIIASPRGMLDAPTLDVVEAALLSAERDLTASPA